MPTINFVATRVVVTSSQPYERVIAALEAQLGRSNDQLLAELIGAHASAEQVTQAVQTMLGPSGLMIVAKIEQGPLLSLLGKSKNATLYVLANPLVANQMFEHTTAIGLYVPLRLCVYTNENGTASIEYDQPSSLLAQFEDAQIAQVASKLDQKLEELANIAAAG